MFFKLDDANDEPSAILFENTKLRVPFAAPPLIVPLFPASGYITIVDAPSQLKVVLPMLIEPLFNTAVMVDEIIVRLDSPVMLEYAERIELITLLESRSVQFPPVKFSIFTVLHVATEELKIKVVALL